MNPSIIAGKVIIGVFCVAMAFATLWEGERAATRESVAKTVWAATKLMILVALAAYLLRP